MMILHGKTDIGQRRKVNQDTFLLQRPAPDAALCVICDGMGGVVGGAEASRMACDAFCLSLREQLEEGLNGLNTLCSDAAAVEARRACIEATIPDALVEAVEAANAAVYSAAENDPALQGMGTTLVALFVWGDYACAVNVGDSRLYAVTAEGARQLSHDHSYVQYLIDMGKLTPEEAKQSTNRNIITRAVGTTPQIDSDIIRIEPELLAGATFLLCSDGLSGMLEDSEIAAVVNSGLAVEEAVDALVARANDAGGTDNITVVLCRA